MIGTIAARVQYCSETFGGSGILPLMSDTDDRTGRVDAVLYGRIVELQELAEYEHTRLQRDRIRPGGPTGGDLLEASADGRAQGLALALEALSGIPAGEHRARAIERRVAAQRAASERIRELRAQLGTSAAQARRERAIDSIDDDGYANALAAARSAL